MDLNKIKDIRSIELTEDTKSPKIETSENSFNDNKDIIAEKSDNVNETKTDKQENTKKTEEETEVKTFDINSYLFNNEDARELFNSLFTIKGQDYYYSRTFKKIEKVKSRADLADLISLDYPQFIVISKKGQRKLSIDSTFLSTAFFENTIDKVIKSIDLFQEEKVKIEKIGKELFITKNSMEFYKPKKLIEDEEVIKEVVKDYKDHFKELDKVLNWIVSNRFTDERRHSYLHLRLSAGFGKSFFKSLLTDLRTITECRYDDFKSPSSLSGEEFENSMALLIDEFTVFKKEFKDMTNKMDLDPKFGLKTRVDLYAKIFLSAEKSNSFADGVDTQITDRVNLIDKDTVKIYDREIYKKYGNKTYYNVILNYVYEFINNRIDYFISLGEIGAANLGEKTLKEFYAQYKLNTKTLDEVIKENFYTKIHELYDVDESDAYKLSSQDRKIYNNILMNDKYIFIKQVKSTFDEVIKSFGEDFYKKARYKTNNFEQIFNTPIKVYKVNGKSVNSARFEIFEFIKRFQDYEQSEIEIVDDVYKELTKDELDKDLSDIDESKIPF